MTAREVRPPSWFVRLAGTPNARRRVVCFPNAGGCATAFRPWSARLGVDTELLAVQFPGRQKRIREPPFRDLHALVDALVPELGPVAGPDSVFFGDCTGALVAYEAIRAADRAGMARPAHLIVSCCRAPGLPPGHQPLHALDDRALVDELRRLAFAPEWLLNEPVTLRGFLGLLRSDFEMVESYVHRPGPPLSMPITAVAGTRDRITREADVAAWRSYTTDRFRSIELEGSHDLALTRVGDMLALIQDSVPGDSGDTTSGS